MSKSATVNKSGFTPFANGGCHVSTFAESICIYKFSECIPENVLIIWVLTNYLLVNAQWMYIQLRFQYVYFVSTKTIKQKFLLCFISSWTIIHYHLYFVFENKYYKYNFNYLTLFYSYWLKIFLRGPMSNIFCEKNDSEKLRVMWSF